MKNSLVVEKASHDNIIRAERRRFRLNANASRLATISDNIANSSTHGYKRAVTDFHSMVIRWNRDLFRRRRADNDVADDRPDRRAGQTNNADLAVRGRGFIPVIPTVISEQYRKCCSGWRAPDNRCRHELPIFQLDRGDVYRHLGCANRDRYSTAALISMRCGMARRTRA